MKEPTAFRMDSAVMAAMRTLKARDGIPFSVQVDRALRAYLETRGITTKADRTRAARKRPTRT
jgi:hypothetical protein